MCIAFVDPGNLEADLQTGGVGRGGAGTIGGALCTQSSRASQGGALRSCEAPHPPFDLCGTALLRPPTPAGATTGYQLLWVLLWSTGMGGLLQVGVGPLVGWGGADGWGDAFWGGLTRGSRVRCHMRTAQESERRCRRCEAGRTCLGGWMGQAGLAGCHLLQLLFLLPPTCMMHVRCHDRLLLLLLLGASVQSLAARLGVATGKHLAEVRGAGRQ